MCGKWMILLILIQGAPLFSSEPPDQEHNASLDPARLIIDSPRHERWHQKADRKKEYQRNHMKKNTARDEDANHKPGSQKNISLQLLAQQLEEMKAKQTPPAEK